MLKLNKKIGITCANLNKTQLFLYEWQVINKCIIDY